jgi:hypothetical protein
VSREPTSSPRCGERRLARHQQHGNAAAEQIVHRGAGVGGADVDMDQHALRLAGDERVAAGHVRGGVLVRAEDDVRQLLAALLAARHLLDDRRVVSAEVAEQMLDPNLVQAFQEIIGGGVVGSVRRLTRSGLGHGYGAFRWVVRFLGA